MISIASRGMLIVVSSEMEQTDLTIEAITGIIIITGTITKIETVIDHKKATIEIIVKKNISFL
jgi:hypothetical protein